MDIINYVSYDAITGKIIQWGRGFPLDTWAWLENPDNQDVTDYYVDITTNTLTPKINQTWSINKIQAQADGEDLIEITNIPLGTLITLYQEQTMQSYEITDGDFQISSILPANIIIRADHYKYQTTSVTVEFI